MENILFDIGIIIIVAAIGSIIANKTKQPLVLAYIITGIILGPVFGLVSDLNMIHTLSEIGIAFLLFIVAAYFFTSLSTRPSFLARGQFCLWA